MPDFTNEQFVKDHIERAITELAAEMHGYVRAITSTQPLESPLETVFYAWWLIMADMRGGGDLTLIPQCDIQCGPDRYRLDFVLGDQSRSDDPAIKVAIELDGHDFHERTKEQVILRNSRDRALAIAGWHVLHFSGSEFHRAPLECIREVIRTAEHVIRTAAEKAR